MSTKNFCFEFLVSVVMPAYNCERFVADAINSALGQTYDNLELIIIDDCSTDNTFSIIEEFAKYDSRIRAFKNEKNLGVASTRNRGFSLALGDYIALLDSDDVWHPEKIERQIQCMLSSEAEFVYTSYALMDEFGTKAFHSYVVPESISVDQMLRNNIIGCSTVMLTRFLAQNYQFCTDYYHEDYVLWLQILKDGYKMVGISDVLVDYRVMLHSKAGNKARSAVQRWKIYRNFMNLSVFSSMKYSLLYGITGVRKYHKRA